MISAILPQQIFTGETSLTNHAVIISGDRIMDIVSVDDLSTDMPRQSYPDSFLAPGFIDTQVNGGGGFLFNDDTSVNGIEGIARTHRQFGTTGLLPTLITDNPDKLEQALAAVNQAIQQKIPGVLGVHLEGPFLNKQRKGVHNAKKFRQPTSSDIQVLTQPHKGKVMVTVAPEMVGIGVIKELATNGIIVSAGHTAATYEQTRNALAAGLKGFTHLFNAMTPLQSREPGVTGAALLDPDSWCGIIADGHHVHYATLKLAIELKPQGKVMLVTDAMPVTGSRQTEFVLDGKTIKRSNNRLETSDGVLAGCDLDMSQAVRNCVNSMGVTVAEALRMASTYPAEYLGLGDQFGYIKSGYTSSLVLLDQQLMVEQTWIDGIACHHKSSSNDNHKPYIDTLEASNT